MSTFQPPSPGQVVRVFPNRERAYFLWTAGALVIVSHGVDIMLAGQLHWSAFAIRSAWGLLLAAMGFGVWFGSPLVVRVMALIAAFGSVAMFLALVRVTGRSQANVLSFTYVLAMTLPLVMPEVLGGAVLASSVLVTGAWTLLWLDGASAAELVGWVHVGVVAIAIASLLGLALRRARLAETTANAAREVMQKRLVESERRRAATERMAATGRLAARVAHEINNPLSAARSNVIFLRERLRHDLETDEAVGDLLAELERIAESVRQIQRLPASSGDEKIGAIGGAGMGE